MFWVGKDLIPADFSIHNEPGKKVNRSLNASNNPHQPYLYKSNEISPNTLDN